MAISFDPMSDPTAQGYTADGNTGMGSLSGGTFQVNDQAGVHLAFFRDEASAGGAVRVQCSFVITPIALDNNVDTGIQFVLDSGSGNQRIELRCTLNGTERRVGFALAGGGVSSGTAYDWATFQTLEFRRETNGDAVLTIGGTDVETVTAANLPASARPNPTFEFGAFSDPAQVIAQFGAITEVGQPPAQTADLTIHTMTIMPNFTERVGFTGTISGGTVDAGAGDVTLRILKRDGSEFYPASRWQNPIAPFTDGTPVDTITPAEKSRTGIEWFRIAPDRMLFSDSRADIDQDDYSQVTVEITVAGVSMSQVVNLSQGLLGGWRKF